MMEKRAQPIPYEKRSGKQPVHLGLVPTETLTFGRIKYSHNEVHSTVNGVLLFYSGAMAAPIGRGRCGAELQMREP